MKAKIVSISIVCAFTGIAGLSRGAEGQPSAGPTSDMIQQAVAAAESSAAPLAGNGCSQVAVSEERP